MPSSTAAMRTKFTAAALVFQAGVRHRVGMVTLGVAWRKYCAAPELRPSIALQVAYSAGPHAFDEDDYIGHLEDVVYESCHAHVSDDDKSDDADFEHASPS